MSHRTWEEGGYEYLEILTPGTPSGSPVPDVTFSVDGADLPGAIGWTEWEVYSAYLDMDVGVETENSNQYPYIAGIQYDYEAKWTWQAENGTFFRGWNRFAAFGGDGAAFVHAHYPRGVNTFSTTWTPNVFWGNVYPAPPGLMEWTLSGPGGYGELAYEELIEGDGTWVLYSRSPAGSAYEAGWYWHQWVLGGGGQYLDAGALYQPNIMPNVSVGNAKVVIVLRRISVGPPPPQTADSRRLVADVYEPANVIAVAYTNKPTEGSNLKQLIIGVHRGIAGNHGTGGGSQAGWEVYGYSDVDYRSGLGLVYREDGALVLMYDTYSGTTKTAVYSVNAKMGSGPRENWSVPATLTPNVCRSLASGRAAGQLWRFHT